MQLFDKGDEKLVEVVGGCTSIEQASMLILQELAWSTPGGTLSVKVFVPDVLVNWILDGSLGVSASLCSGEINERQILLQGTLGPLRQAFGVLSLRIRRHSRLGSEVLVEEREGDPSDDYYSTENFRLSISGATASLLSPGALHGPLIGEIQEDTGATVRVQSREGNAAVEIAGSFGSKRQALLEVTSLLTQLDPHLEFLLPCGECAIDCASARDLVTGAGAEFEFEEGRREGVHAIVRITGRWHTCCAAALELGREAERRALARERVHGPSPLLVDYIARFRSRALPVSQIIDCEHVRARAAPIKATRACALPPPLLVEAGFHLVSRGWADVFCSDNICGDFRTNM